MSDLSAADIAEGHRLDKAATGGPWETHVSRTDVLPGRETREIVRPNGDLHPWNVLKAGNTCCWPPTDADAELIVWARNHLPALLDAADRGRALEAAVAAFINERPSYITACRAPVIKLSERDRLEGASGALRDLAQRLGWTVPSKPGEKTMPKEASGE